MKLRIASNFTLPADAATETFAILGIRGSGKTNTAVVMAEELLKAGQQVVILDPVDVWWGLKSAHSIPVIGGNHADIPLDATAGAVLADFVTDARASVILSLRHLSMNDQRRFAGDFAKRLYDRKGQQRSPLMLMVDEADEFVPQRLPHGHEAMFGAFDRLVRRGRSSGIGVTLISQRPQVINKDVLSQMGTLIALRVLHKLDRKALEAWIEAHDTEGRQDEFMGSLASLGRGDAWIWSPSWLNCFQRVHIRGRETFDSSATPTAGAKLTTPKALTPVDLEQLRESMAATIEQAKLDDPKALRARIAQLERQLKTKPATEPAPDSAAIEEEAYQRGLQEGRGQSAIIAEEWREEWQSARKYLESAIQHVGAGFDRIHVPPKTAPLPPIVRRNRTTEARPAKPAPAAAASNDDAPIGGAAQRVLDALAELEALGVEQAPRVQVGFMAGYTNLNSKGFKNAIGALRSAGQIDYPNSGSIALTAAGRAKAEASDTPRTSEELQSRIINMLGGPNGRIIRELVQVHPDPLPREELAERAGYTNVNSKGFKNAIGRLRTLGFIDYPERGQVRAADLLFLQRRRAGA